MKKTLLIAAVSVLMISCGSGADEEKLSEYSADVCKCAEEAQNQEEWDACNEKRKKFFGEFSLDKDDDAGNKHNDTMYECLSENESF